MLRLVGGAILYPCFPHTLGPADSPRPKRGALELSSALAGRDPRSGRPILTVTVTAASTQALHDLSAGNIGRKAEMRTDGKTVITTVFREPLVTEVWKLRATF
jgi:hypothetical protein